MRNFYLLLFTLFTFSLSSYAQAVDTLTNEKVIKLFKAGFSKATLKSKIETSVTNFNTSIDGMLNLKKAGLPEDIINLMITREAKGSTITKTTTYGNARNVETAAVTLASGIYHKNPSGEMIEIEPSILTNTKTDRGAQVFISGLINAKTKASLSDKESSTLIYEGKPSFYFVFDTTSSTNLNNENNVWFGGTRSPKEFLLVKLVVNKNSREITVGKGNVINSDFGIDEKSIVHFSSKRISKGIYEVTSDAELSPGEYCFMFAQGIKQGQSSKVFDFSIRQAKSF